MQNGYVESFNGRIRDELLLELGETDGQPLGDMRAGGDAGAPLSTSYGRLADAEFASQRGNRVDAVLDESAGPWRRRRVGVSLSSMAGAP